MQVETFVSITGQAGRYFVIAGRSRPELFSARLMNGSATLQVTWTESLGMRTIANRLAQIQKLAGGLGCITRITATASDNLQTLVRLGRFPVQEAAQRLGQSLGGTWRVDVVPRPSSSTWDIVARLLGD